MKKNDRVRVLRDDKYVPAIVNDVEAVLGFKKLYTYYRVWVEFLDATVKEYRGYDVIEIIPKEPKEIIDKKSKPKV